MSVTDDDIQMVMSNAEFDFKVDQIPDQIAHGELSFYLWFPGPWSRWAPPSCIQGVWKHCTQYGVLTQPINSVTSKQ